MSKRYENLEIMLILNTHKDILEKMTEDDKTITLNLIDTYLNSDLDEKKKILKLYYKEIKDKYADKVKFIKEFKIKDQIKPEFLSFNKSDDFSEEYEDKYGEDKDD